MKPLRNMRGGLASLRDHDQLAVPTEPQQLRWGTLLIGFMRVMSLIWLVKGLLAWGAILGLTLPAPPFEARSTGYQAGMIYFAVMDLVAGVGLWLAATWGGVLWLLAVMSHLILAVFFPRFVSNGALLIAVFILAIMSYLTLSWLAAIEE